MKQQIFLLINSMLFRRVLGSLAVSCHDIEVLWFCIVTKYVCFNLLEPKVISLCHQYRAWTACTSVLSDQALYCWLTNFSEIIMDRSKKNGRWLIFLRNSAGLMVNLHENKYWLYTRYRWYDEIMVVLVNYYVPFEEEGVYCFANVGLSVCLSVGR